MGKDFPSAPSYVRLLNLLAAVRKIAPFTHLEADEEHLLNALALIWHEPRNVTVADVMREANHVSRSTIYRRLLGLKRKGLVEFKDDRTDRRLKFVLPTDLAEDYISRLSACVDDLHIEARS